MVRASTHDAMGLILHGGPIELFLIPASAPRLVNKGCGICYHVLWDDAYKRILAANQKE